MSAFAALPPAVQRIVRMILCDGWTAEALDTMTDLMPVDIERAVQAVEEHPTWDASICA